MLRILAVLAASVTLVNSSCSCPADFPYCFSGFFGDGYCYKSSSSFEFSNRCPGTCTSTGDVLHSSCNSADDTSSLLNCARRTVAMHSKTIQANLAKKGISVIDLAWPGTGYNTAACGGQFEVLTALEKSTKQRVVGKIMGASGGASGAVSALSDAGRSAKTLLNVQYHFVHLLETQGLVWTGDEIKRYKADMDRQNTFSQVKASGYAALLQSSDTSFSTMVYNFASSAQAARAFAASGAFVSTTVPGLGGCHDGAHVCGVAGSRNALLYYNTDYGYHASISHRDVALLFKLGVKDTITMLLEPSLWQDRGSTGGSMGILKPDRRGWTLDQYESAASGFWNILTSVTGANKVRFADGSAGRGLAASSDTSASPSPAPILP
jgi:hypothetical protein